MARLRTTTQKKGLLSPVLKAPLPKRKGRGGPRANSGGARPGAGHPFTYTPARCAEVEKYLAQGYSLSGTCGCMRIDRATMLRWIEHFPDFAQAAQNGLSRSTQFWEDLAIKAGQGKNPKASPAILIFALKNRAKFDWRDKIEHEITGADGGPIKTVTRIERHIIDTRPPDIIEGSCERVGDDASNTHS